MVNQIRLKRIESQIQKDLGLVLPKLKDTRLSLVTVTSVELQTDMRLATIKVICSDEPDTVVKSLNRAKGFIKRELAGMLGLRYMPDITFVYDKGIEYEQYMTKLFEELKNEEDK